MSSSLIETSYTRAIPYEITKFQESLAKCDEQFLKLRYPPGAERSCFTLLLKRVTQARLSHIATFPKSHAKSACNS